jgi:hypothetical protein
MEFAKVDYVVCSVQIHDLLQDPTYVICFTI